MSYPKSLVLQCMKLERCEPGKGIEQDGLGGWLYSQSSLVQLAGII